MSVIERAKQHREAVAMRSIDVPEWGAGGKPLTIYSKPLSVAGRRKCWRNPAGETLDGFLAMARAVVFHAVDRSGKRLFDDMDEKAMTYDVDSDVVARVGAFILGFDAAKGPPAIDEQVEEAKND